MTARQALPLLQPVPAFDFQVLLMDAHPEYTTLGQVGKGALDVALDVGKGMLFGAFSEVSGLDAGMELEEYREGGRNTGPRQFVKWGKYPPLVLRHGVTASPELWDWYYAVLWKTKNPVRKNGVIVLNDRGGIAGAAGAPATPVGLPFYDRLPTAIWFFRDALPQRVQGPTLNAKSSEIAIEALELVHQGLYRIGPSMVPGLGTVTDFVGL